MSQSESINPSWNPVTIGNVRRYWWLFLAMGVLLVLLGVAALGASVAVTVTSMIFFGLLLLAGGAVEVARAFWNRRSGGFPLHLLTGILYGIAGLVLASNPMAGAMALTLLIGGFLLVGGIFRAITALVVQYRNWFWGILSGVVGVLLGGALLTHWPVSSLWAIGMFVGIDLIFYGVSVTMASLAVRALASIARPEEGGQQQRKAA